MKAKARTNASTDLILIVSRNHLTKNTLSSIEVTVDFGIRTYRAGRRYIIQLRDAEYNASSWPGDLRQITDYALKNGCGWIAIDEFAPVNPDLPSYP